MDSNKVLIELSYITNKLYQLHYEVREAQSRKLRRASHPNETLRQNEIRAAIDHIKVQAYRLAPLSRDIHEFLSKEQGCVDLIAFAIAEQMPVLARIDQSLSEDLGRLTLNRSWLYRALFHKRIQRKKTEILSKTLDMASEITAATYVLYSILLTHLVAEGNNEDDRLTSTVSVITSLWPTQRWGLDYESHAYWNIRRLHQLIAQRLVSS